MIAYNRYGKDWMILYKGIIKNCLQIKVIFKFAGLSEIIMELYIKKMKSAAYIRKLKNDPAELDSLVNKTR